ncbi:MAG TPA: hypothetical protein VHD35_05730 [Chitinophagaceae bacterium]|nr:hypothetical protein [Chitinophagaceae bacterium]
MNDVRSMFSSGDIFFAPLCYMLLFVIYRSIIRKYTQEHRSVFIKAFHFRMFCAIVFALIVAYYYKEGDSEMYYYATLDMQKAVMQDGYSLWKIFTTLKIDAYNSLAPYFFVDRDRYPVLEFMASASNFTVPKLALIPSILFFKSYVSICMMFSFFALGGAVRLYKLFCNYFPLYKREIAFAVLFLPSVCFWSSGLLKDSICFGAVGYILYGIFSIFIRKKKILGSVLWVIVGVGLLYYIKVYILLALLPSITLWLFGEFNKAVKDPLLRKIATFFTIAIASVLVVVLINYVTSAVNLSSFRLENILETSDFNRKIYENDATKLEGSYFQIQSGNPTLIIINGFIASLFRPFIWEISSPIVLLSALEALIFILLTGYFLMKKGVVKYFRSAFGSPVLILCSSFAFVFAASVGSTATNFGSLSRYKIPCLPFYLIMIFAIYFQNGLKLPIWTNRIFNLISKKSS